MAAAAVQSVTSHQESAGRIARDAYLKLAVAIAATWMLLLIAGFLYADQADRYSEPHVVAVLLQIVYETPFQPLFLVIVLVPIYLAAARSASWTALGSGGLMMMAAALPQARFQSLDISGIVAADPVLSVHNSLMQLAGPGHQMPEFVSVVTLLLMGGVTALFWQPRVGGIIGLMGLISMAFVWNAAYDDPAAVAGRLKIAFLDSKLQFGYYLAWAGATLGVLDQWRRLPWIRHAFRQSESAS